MQHDLCPKCKFTQYTHMAMDKQHCTDSVHTVVGVLDGELNGTRMGAHWRCDNQSSELSVIQLSVIVTKKIFMKLTMLQ